MDCMQNLIFFIIGSLFFGCANLDVARQAYQEGDYNRSFNIYNKWAEAGFGEANLKLIELASDNDVQKGDNFIINRAPKANYKKAANILFVAYLRKQDIPHASIWFKKVDFNTMNQSQFNMYLSFLINYVKKMDIRRAKLEKLEKFAIDSENEKALYALGNFYETALFLNLQKSEKYYQLAYRKNYILAGIKLGLLYIYKLHKSQEGLGLLKKMANKDSGKTAYEIAMYFLQKMDKEIQQMNTPCISFNFDTPKQFFIKKIKVKKYRSLFLKTNIIPWLNYSYKKGYVLAKLKLISLDLQFDNFKTEHTLCKMDLLQTIKFLQSTNMQKAKIILAKIYTTYPNLNRHYQAEIIYKNYIQHNKLVAYWGLYQYYKKFKPNSKEQKFYLNQLVSNNFVPAIVEKAHFDKNITTLNYYAKQDNVSALTYLSSIYADNHSKERQIPVLRKLCRLTSPINPSLDIKIAKTYKDMNKSATIYQYYADNNVSSSQYYLANIYKKLNECNKTIYWLKQSKSGGYLNAQLEYDKLVLDGYIDDDIAQTVTNLQSYSKDSRVLILLGDLYAKGILTDFNPKKAIKYYKKSIKLGNNDGYIRLIRLYKILDLAGNMKQKIINTYQQLIENSKKDRYKYQIMLANYYYSRNSLNRAKQILIKNNLKKYPDGRYLLSVIEGRDIYISADKKTMNSNLLLLYAKKNMPKSKTKALYYAFLSALRGNKNAPTYILYLLKYFVSYNQVMQIYQKAKNTYN